MTPTGAQQPPDVVSLLESYDGSYSNAGQYFDSDDDKQAILTCMASSTAIPFARTLLEHMIPSQYHPDTPLEARFTCVLQPIHRVRFRRH